MTCTDPTRRAWLGAAALLAGCATAPPPPGRVERLMDTPRPVDVWLPPGWQPGAGHAVLYMHDGQMLFDARGTWNGQSWNVPATAARLIAAGQVRPFIVVGAWNSGTTRFADYFPQPMFDALPKGPVRRLLLERALGGAPRSDAYLRWLVDELRPAVEARYAPARGPGSTFVAGSSMGGLISLYALLRHPGVFGGAACLSTHWIGGFERNAEVPAAALAWLRRDLPPPGRHRLYLDRGTAGLDALYDEAQARVDALLAERGWAPPLLQSRVFEGADHTETDWARRLEVPLRHLLSP